MDNKPTGLQPERVLEVLTVGTGVLVGLTVGIALVLHLTGELGPILTEIGTFPVSLLFGYLWLLALVGASQVKIGTAIADGEYRRQLENGAIVGVGISLVYLTVVFIIGFVAPTPAVFDPANQPMVVIVGVGVIGGAVGGLLIVASLLGLGIYSKRLTK